MSILNRLKDEQPFTESEKAVVSFIRQYPQTVVHSSIGKIAELSYSSPSTIGRVCKKLGTNGFSELKIKLATELNQLIVKEENVDAVLPVGPDDRIQDFPKIFFNLHHQALLSAYHSIRIQDLQKAANILYRADVVYVLGSQQSMILAQDFLCKTAKLGLPFINPYMSGFNNNLYKQKRAKRQAALIISQFASSRRVDRWIKELKQIKAESCLITTNRESPNIWKVNHTILIDNEESISGKMGNFTARTAMSYVLDILFAILFMKDYDDNLANLQKRQDLSDRPDW